MRKRKDFKRKEGIRSSRLIVIATEGRYTENIYFEAMKASFSASNVHVKILRRDTNNSNPKNVYNQIHIYEKEYDINEDDQLWVVVDRDKWKEKMLADVARYCAQNKNLNFCLSNPCFELWLILHLEDVSTYTEEQRKNLAENKKKTKNGDTWTKRRMKYLMAQYSESNYNAMALLPEINIAIKRAENLDTNKNDRWPQTIGTRVYLLAKSIMGK